MNNNSIVIAIIVVIAVILGYRYFKQNKNKEGYYGDNYFPVSGLKDQYLADMPTYSNCPYIPVSARPHNWPGTMTSYVPGETEQNRIHKYVYSDNPQFNFY